MNKAIFAGRVFTRRMYADFEGCIIKKGNSIQLKSGKILSHSHHINLSSEFRLDCKVWELFLTNIRMVNRPKVDLEKFTSAVELDFATDSSLNPNLGFGCVFSERWTFGQWERGFAEKYKPSIAYLELFCCFCFFQSSSKEKR